MMMAGRMKETSIRDRVVWGREGTGASLGTTRDFYFKGFRPQSTVRHFLAFLRVYVDDLEMNHF